MAARIILIDADPEAGAGLAEYLGGHGLPTVAWTAADHLMQRLATDPPWLVLLHRRLGDDPDLGLLRRLRACSAVPAIIRAMDGDDEVDRVLALELGADDYLPRGASRRELLARIRSVLRRARGAVAAPAERRSRWRLCLQQREVFSPDGAARNLTSTEFELIQLLARQQGVAVHRDALSLAVLRRPYHPEDRALDNLVLRLRRKLGDDGASARLVKSVRGVGYVFVGFEAAAQAAPQPDGPQPAAPQPDRPPLPARVENSQYNLYEHSVG